MQSKCYKANADLMKRGVQIYEIGRQGTQLSEKARKRESKQQSVIIHEGVSRANADTLRNASAPTRAPRDLQPGRCAAGGAASIVLACVRVQLLMQVR